MPVGPIRTAPQAVDRDGVRSRVPPSAYAVHDAVDAVGAYPHVPFQPKGPRIAASLLGCGTHAQPGFLEAEARLHLGHRQPECLAD